MGSSTLKKALKNKLKNLIAEIRFTNMGADEFTSIVAPTELLSDEDKVSVFSYLCGNEVTRYFNLLIIPSVS